MIVKFPHADITSEFASIILPFLFAQIDKIEENFVRPDEYLSTPMNIFFR